MAISKSTLVIRSRVMKVVSLKALPNLLKNSEVEPQTGNSHGSEVSQEECMRSGGPPHEKISQGLVENFSLKTASYSFKMLTQNLL